jgi:hypothetical protein
MKNQKPGKKAASKAKRRSVDPRKKLQRSEAIANPPPKYIGETEKTLR